MTNFSDDSKIVSGLIMISTVLKPWSLYKGFNSNKKKKQKIWIAIQLFLFQKPLRIFYLSSNNTWISFISERIQRIMMQEKRRWNQDFQDFMIGVFMWKFWKEVISKKTYPRFRLYRQVEMDFDFFFLVERKKISVFWKRN